ncbi:serine/threonine-protein kinase [Streptomyces lancefieldiae]|uniref:non-specific serine/threonine protein kinase n=1 Tax=Streptomyces lancefieldiae TaxID=3075520 RepID=A0ABU3AJ55_9ACTN|nr:protein kinase [Streptomyces sp. DSM 40712]MDT0610224.1 protein kinase [Streptomyces sp. DSM 40712]
MQGRLLAGRYRLGEAIGSGGMGRVWRAHDEVLNRAVAIKELTAALYVSESDQAILLARTRSEARAAARINHSAVVTVHDVLEHDGRPWIVMELVEGRSLADAVKEEERVEPREAARVGLWVLRALCAAHAAGVLHRDVKPGNVLLGDDGRVLLTDFGIAQIEGDSTITRTGEVVGSVDYLAPERVRGHDPGPASDLWALGATLYTAVEGRSPFRRTSPLTTMQAVVEEEATKPRYAGPLAPVITALLRKDPATRPDATETEHMLAQAAEGRRPNAAQAYVPTQYAGARGHGDTAHPGRPGAAERAGGHAPTHYPSATGPTAVGSTAVGPPPVGHHSAPGPMATGPTAVGHHPAAGPMTTGPTAVGHHPAAGPMTTGPTATGYAAAGPVPTGPTATGHAPNGPTGTAPVRSRRRRLRTLALVVVVAAVVGAGTAVMMHQRDDGGSAAGPGATDPPSPSASLSASASASPSPSASATTGEGPSGSVPAGWVRQDDPVGFSLSLPEGWQRKVYSDTGELRQVDYTPDGGEHFIRIAVDTAPDYNDPYTHQLDLEEQLQRLVGYQRVTLERTTYRDRDSARWEYTWTALAKDGPFPGPRRAVEEMYMSRDGVEYAIYMSGPANDWPTTQRQFEAVLRSWEEKPA